MEAAVEVDRHEKDRVAIVFLSVTPLVGVVGTAVYTSMVGFEWWMLGLCATLYLLVGLSVTSGYHRFFANKSYECARPVQLLDLVFGALAVQGPVLNWASGHRQHHKHVDDEWDPARWLIWGLEKLGLARRLKRMPAATIAWARFESSVARVQERLDRVSEAVAAEARQALRAAREALERALELRRQVVACRRWRSAERLLGAAEPA